jgi:branched-chain amino acid transport system substrate-binding protein
MRVKAIVAAAGCALALSATGAAAEQVLKIGLVTTLSGGGAILGEELKRGWDLGVDLLGGKIGGLPIEMSIVDDETKPEIAVTAIDKLLHDTKVDIVAGVVWSNVQIAIYDPIVKSQTILLNTNAGSNVPAGKDCSPYFITTSWQSDQFTEATAELVRADGIKKVYVVAPNYQIGKDVDALFREQFKGDVVGDILFKLGQTDFQAELSEIRAARPESVVAFAPGAMSIALMKQWQALELSKSIRLYTINMIDELTLPALGEAVVGTYFASVYDVSQDIPANRRFVAAYQKKYSRLPTQYAAQTYDGVMLLDAGLRARNGDASDHKALVAAMHNAKFDSVRGPLHFSNNNFPVENMYRIQVVAGADGKPRLQGAGIIVKDQADRYHQECPMQ